MLSVAEPETTRELAADASRGADAGLPKFLVRDGGQAIGAIPPPLPREPVLRVMRRALTPLVESRRFLAGAAAAPFAAATLYFAAASTQTVSPPRPVEAQRPRNEVAEAVRLVAQVEQRLQYAAGLSRAEAVDATEAARAAVAFAKAVEDEPDPVEWIVLRNLPAGATLSTGAPAGPGAWVLSASSTEQLADVLDQGFESAVTADAQLISRSGLPVGQLKLQLVKPQAVAEADADMEKADAPQQIAAPRPVKRKRLYRAHRSTNKLAGHETREARRRAHHAQDAYQARAVAPQPYSAPQQAETADAAQEQPSGPISKFFAWIKGDNKKQEPEVAEQPANDHTRRGLGIAPQE